MAVTRWPSPTGTEADRHDVEDRRPTLGRGTGARVPDSWPHSKAQGYGGALGKKRLDDITDEDVQQLKFTLRHRKPTTVNNVFSVLSMLLKRRSSGTCWITRAARVRISQRAVTGPEMATRECSA